jgi:hypothetical protein
LTAGQPTLFELGLRRASEVHLVVGNKWERMKPHPHLKGVYQLTAQFPQGAWPTLVTGASDGSGFTTLVDFAPEEP